MSQVNVKQIWTPQMPEFVVRHKLFSKQLIDDYSKKKMYSILVRQYLQNMHSISSNEEVSLLDEIAELASTEFGVTQIAHTIAINNIFSPEMILHTRVVHHHSPTSH